MLTPQHGARLQCTQGMWAADQDQFHRSWVSQQIFLPFNVLSAVPSTLDTLCIAGCYTTLDMLDTDQDLV